MEYKATVNGQGDYTVEVNDAGAITLNGIDQPLDLVPVGKNHFHLLLNQRSYNVVVLGQTGKQLKLEINGSIYQVSLQDKYDALLKQLGMEKADGGVVRDVKAPMPGLVLDVMVEGGRQVEKDEPLVILEAMKMENILKSPTAGIIKDVNVVPNQSVDKNEILITFE